MDTSKGEFYEGKALADFLNLKENASSKLIEETASKKGMVLFRVGDEVEIKGGRFKITYINDGKNRITLQGVPKNK